MPYMPQEPEKKLCPLQQPMPFESFQVVEESERIRACIYALDIHGTLWLKVYGDPAGWQREDDATKQNRPEGEEKP